MSSSPRGGGGGEVNVAAGGDGGSPTLESRYQKAIELMRRKEWDAAFWELKEVSERAPGTPVANQAAQQLRIVETNLYATPVTPLSSVIRSPEGFQERNVSLRGTYVNGGPVGASTYYFYLKDRTTVQCRYGRLSLDDKQRILKTSDGARVFVRGTVKPPWGTNPDPYLDVTLFRTE